MINNLSLSLSLSLSIYIYIYIYIYIVCVCVCPRRCHIREKEFTLYDHLIEEAGDLKLQKQATRMKNANCYLFISRPAK